MIIFGLFSALCGVAIFLGVSMIFGSLMIAAGLYTAKEELTDMALNR